MSAQPPPPPPPQPPYGPPQPPRPAYGPPPPGFKVDPGELRPRRLWYWVAGLIAIASIAGSVVLFIGAGDKVGSLVDVVGDLTPLETPGQTTVQLEAGDQEAIYRQVDSAEGPVFSDPRVVNRLRCEVRDPGGAPVELGRPVNPTRLSLNFDVYVVAFTFEAPETGSYRVACTTPGGVPLPLQIGPEVDLGEIFGFIGGIFAGIGVLAIGLIAAIAIVIPVAIMRSNHKRRLGREAAAIGM